MSADDAIYRAVVDANIGHYAMLAANAVAEATADYVRPSAIYRPKVFKDGNAWCALYGDNLVEGVSAFGNTPHEATRAFDDAWYKP